MEAWLSELEVEMMQNTTFINEACPQYKHHQGETMETSFHEEIAATLVEDFPYPVSAESDTSSLEQWDFDYSLVDPFSPSPFFVNDIDDHNNSYNNNNNNIDNSFDSNNEVIPREAKSAKESSLESDGVPPGGDQSEDGQPKSEKEESKQQPTRTGKRRREPSQAYDHIMAERKRRELLTQRFIALSALVPGLKKTDKTSVLGEAIKYLKQLKEKVNTLEEVAAKRTVESIVMVNTQLSIDDDENNSGTTNVAANGSGDGSSGKKSLTELEVKVSDKTLLIRIYCEKRKEIISKLFVEMDKHELSITNTSIMSFGSLALDITITAQMEKGLNKDVKDLIRSVRSVLTTASQGPNQKSGSPIS